MVTNPNIPSLSGSFVVPQELLEDSSKTLVDLYDWNLEHNPAHPLFRFHNGSDLKTISWKEAVLASHRAARFFESFVPQQPRPKPAVVGILANTDTITYFCSIMGMFRAGFTVFPISTRNSAEAVRHLLTVTNVEYLFISREPVIESLAEAALKDGRTTALHHMPEFGDLFVSAQENGVALYPRRTHDPDAPSLILHSSGSTAFPKPIVRSARRVKEWTLIPWYGDINLTGMTMSCHVLPMFHGMGVLQLATTASCGLVISAFKPSSPAVIATPVNVFDEAKATNSDMICSVPSIIETWATDAEKVAHLKTLKGIIFGGGPLSKSVGDVLASHGVCIYTSYGSTEAGVISKFFPEHPGKNWDHMIFSKQMSPEFVPVGDGTYELVLGAHDGWTPLVVNATINGKDAFSTKDLFIPHESEHGLWKIYGRADDQIMLSTGEKTNPGPLENIMAQDPHVQAAVMFGRGRPQNGILIEPKKQFVFDTNDATAAEAFKDTIWATVERMNSFAPQHSRIFKELILIAAPEKPFTYTAKATARRQAVLRDYEDEIEALYRAVDSTSSKIPPPSEWDEDGTREFIRTVVTTVLRRHVEDGADIFRFGCDSLQATWIRNQIILALRATVGDHSDALPQSCVYQAPSIAQLTELVLSTVGASQNGDVAETVPRAKILQDLVSQYTTNFPERPTVLRKPEDTRDVVILTGSTGGLGAHILLHLLQDPAVGKVYALNRVSASVRQQRETFKRNGLDEALLDSPKFQFLTGDLSQPSFGLDLSVYEELLRFVTHIIHNAWKVDFNQSLGSYEPLLVGVRNLVNFCLSSSQMQAPHVLFTSSMGVFRKLPEVVPALEEPIDDASVCVGPGYSESKWLAEQILLTARKQVGLQTVVARLGQICGGFNGYWNEREWFPALVKSAIYVRCLPNIEGVSPSSTSSYTSS
ncbi:hypothetical protein NM688_g8049 [Phlebia brevispora]|uniref:Uncharacterized protein n=1 Tax=Phlebia brevispora TaxID=194682 RepID=A0ACC1RY60_9APHY|nr:hypothetical protein NM688_g8049 [Phlebia brevispora]